MEIKLFIIGLQKLKDNPHSACMKNIQSYGCMLILPMPPPILSKNRSKYHLKKLSTSIRTKKILGYDSMGNKSGCSKACCSTVNQT